MRFRNAFDRIGDKLARYERVFHPLVPHRDTVAYADRRKFYRSTACHADARLCSFGDTVEFEVTRNDFVFRTAYADERTTQFFVRISHRIKQRTMRCAFHTFFCIIAFHLCHCAPPSDGIKYRSILIHRGDTSQEIFKQIFQIFSIINLRWNKHSGYIQLRLLQFLHV